MGAVPDVTFMEVVGVRIQDDILEEARALPEVLRMFDVGDAPPGIVEVRVGFVAFLVLHPLQPRNGDSGGSGEGSAVVGSSLFQRQGLAIPGGVGDALGKPDFNVLRLGGGAHQVCSVALVADGANEVRVLHEDALHPAVQPVLRGPGADEAVTVRDAEGQRSLTLHGHFDVVGEAPVVVDPQLFFGLVPGVGDRLVAALHHWLGGGVQHNFASVSGGAGQYGQRAALHGGIEEQQSGGVVGSPVADLEVHRYL